MPSVKFLALLLTLLSTHGSCRELKQLGLAQNATVLNCEIDDPTECPIAQSCVPISTSAAICATPPISGAVISTDPATFPVPTAYFPLTGQTLNSWPRGEYNGTLRGAVWRQDPEFGSVLHCKEGLNDLVQLENVPIGTEGPFTVNLWMKKAVTSSFFGASHQFLFSVGNEGQEKNESFDPAIRNQLHLFLPEESNARHGLIRVIVKDDNDDETEVYYMDSDGRVNDDVLRNDSLPHVELADGQWHMLTVSSIPSRRGFRIFVDGEMMAETPRRTRPPGGDSMKMDGRLHLCGRIDEKPDRHFDGSLAKLSIFDQSLTKRQIRVLFKSVKSSTLENQIQSSQRLQEWNQKTNSTLFVNQQRGVRYIRGPEVDPALVGRSDPTDASLAPLQFNLRQFSKQITLCSTNPEAFGLDPEDFCTGKEVCSPVHTDTLVLLHEMSNLTSDEAFGLTGICAEAPQSGAILPGVDSGIPPPLAYFPLIDGDLTSWPVPNARGVSIAAELVEDPVFGAVFECSQSNQSFLILDNVPYGEFGPFAFSLWFQALDLEGENFQYLLSHGPVSPLVEVWGPNQVQIYLGETNHTTAGLVRAIVKDSGDVDGQSMFLDSDGDVALVLNKDRERTRNQLVNISDSAWHMLTISTQQDFRKGFSMFLDGRFVAEIRDDVIYTGDDGEVLEANGGQPLRPGGKIYLCGRYDGIPTRHFSGRIAEIMFFDQPLMEDQVSNLYGAALRAQPGLINGGRKLLQDSEAQMRPPGSWWGVLTSQSGTRMGPCLPETQDCEIGLTCVPVESPDEEQDFDRTGICVKYPPNGAYIFDSGSEIEVPIGYFPLTNGSLESWPFPTFLGNASRGVQFIEDEVFGSVLDCSESTQDHVILDNVPFVSETGDFTVAFWIRQHLHHLNDSSDFGFEFVFSQISGSTSYTGLTDPNQLQVLIPRSDAGLPGRVRVVVRDDEDEGEDLVFLDSNQDSSQVDLNDGLWHMVAISSRPRATKGFRVFIDGVLVNELRGQEATGGGPMMLMSDIHLCGRADGANGTFFDGNLAHLLLWDSALTQTQLFALYERFILANEGVQIDHPLRQTIEGDPCVFPGILKGQIYIDCAPLDEVFKCPVRNGTWVECRAFNESSLAIFNTSIVRQTIDGEDCKMPGILNGREVFGCVDLGGRFSCEIRPGQWKECAPLLELRYTISGAPCVFPFFFEGRQYSNCVPALRNESFCQISNGEYQTCAPAVFQEDLQISRSPDPEVQGPMPVLVDQVISRIARNGDTCSFPFWFEGLSVGGCVQLQGEERCQTRNGTLELCSPLTYTTEGTPCALPFPADSTMNFGCINRNNDEVCRVANGSFASCDVESSIRNQSNTAIPLLPGRVTLSNESCAFPFWYEGELVSDCVGSNSMERCMTNKGVLKECRPKRVTQDGDQCSFPFQFVDSLAFDCVMLGGLEQCRTANGSMEVCAPVPTGPLMDRFSLQGLPCRFPFSYNGTEMQDCVLIENEESCKISGGEWATCAPLVEAKVFNRRTKNGQECVIPFQYENRLFTDCFRDQNGDEMCRTEDPEGPLEECTPKEDNNRGMNGLVQYPYERNTTDGVHCVFPFQYQDELWIECVDIDGIESCKIGDGTWQECEPKEQPQSSVERPSDFTPRFAVDGDECLFPLAYNGEELYNCIEVDGTEQCKDEEGNWEECAPLESTERQGNFTPRFAVDGDECAFPLAYNGEELYNCIEIDGTEQCKDEEGNWEECAPLEDTGRPENFTPRFAVDGDECAFPLAYNGEELYNCIEIDGTEQCKDEEGNWEECAPLESTERPGNFTPRFAVDGDECAFPLAYNGEELYNCIEINGIEQCKDEEGNWEECAPLAGSGNPRDFTSQVTVNGGQCVFPLSYNGEEFNDCVEIDGTEQCRDESGTWQECISQEADRPIVTLSEGDEEEDGDDSSISAGAIVGIIIAVLIGVLVVVLVVGFVVFKYRQNQDRNVEISRKHFERYEGGGESDIAMATISSQQRV